MTGCKHIVWNLNQKILNYAMSKFFKNLSRFKMNEKHKMYDAKIEKKIHQTNTS